MPDNEDLLQQFTEERTCEYKGRSYLVRDNGAVYRLRKSGRNPSKCDETWTFGIKDPISGYMFLASSVRVHQVVCTAFHGPAPYPEMVVDHRDANRCNNRPENLRWVTRLENALKNEYTRNRIIYLCGSVEAFLENPSILQSKALPPNVSWMRTVTKEEADIYKKRMDELSLRKPAKEPLGEGFGEWVFEPKAKPNTTLTIEELYKKYPRKELAAYCEKQYAEPMSLFPCSPPVTVEHKDVIHVYCSLLQTGADFLLSRYYKLVVVKTRVFDDGSGLRVLSERQYGSSANWYLFDIWTDGKVLFHQKIATYSLLKEKIADEAFYEMKSVGNLSNDPGKSYYCVNEGGVIRIRSGYYYGLR